MGVLRTPLSRYSPKSDLSEEGSLTVRFLQAVPPVLKLTYGFTLEQAGLAFIAAIAGALLAAASSILIERIAYPREVKKTGNMSMVDIEYRFLPAVVGSVFITTALFWIGWTAKPSVSWASPVIGTGLFVWGNMMVLVRTAISSSSIQTPMLTEPPQISIISYLFDAFAPPETLSALTVAASLRLLVAAAIPLVIIQDITRLGGGWAYSIFGFIAAALMVLPYLGYRFGSEARAKSRYNQGQMMAIGEKMVEQMEGGTGSTSQMMSSVDV
jgi:DHA1 family multidrug resistance protein-like MFS transporter